MKEGVESLGRVRAQAMVLLAIAFLAGAFIGGTIERVMFRPARSSIGLSRGGPRGGERGVRSPAGGVGWYESLGLTADQRAKIDEILRRRGQRVDSAMNAACMVIGPARDSSFREIDALLTAAQKAKRDSVRTARRDSARVSRLPVQRSGPRGGPFGCPMPPREAPPAKQ